jgi:hypothetical protein
LGKASPLKGQATELAKRGGLGLEEGVGVAFVADGGGGAVAGVDNRVVREMEQFGFQGIDDLVQRAAPKIGAADAAGEKCIPGEELGFGELDCTSVLGEIEADAAGSVAGSVNYVGLEAAPTESVAFLEQMIDIDELGWDHAEEVGLHVHGVIEGEIVVVHHDGRAGIEMELGKAADMIDVGVGADDDFDGEPVTAEKIEDAFDFIARVDDDGFVGLWIADDKTVALKHADGDLDVDHLRVSGIGEIQGVGNGGHRCKYSIVHLRGGFWVREEGDRLTEEKKKQWKSERVKEYKSAKTQEPNG